MDRVAGIGYVAAFLVLECDVDDHDVFSVLFQGLLTGGYTQLLRWSCGLYAFRHHLLAVLIALGNESSWTIGGLPDEVSVLVDLLTTQ